MPHTASSGGSKVKGLAFRSVMRCLIDLRGEEVSERALAAMTEQVATPLRYGSIVASTWYPAAWYRDMWNGIRAGTGESLEIARLIGREAINRDLNMVHKLLFKMLSPETIVALGARLFSSYYDPAKVEISSRPGFTAARYTQCIDWDENMFTEVLGSTQMVLELAGAHNVRCRMVTGGRTGDDYAEMEAHWTGRGA